MRQHQPPVRPPTKPATAAPAQAKEELLDASDLWLALMQVPRPTRLVPFPRSLPGTREAVGEVAIQPLTQGESIESNAAADDYVKSLFKDPQKREEVNLGYNHSFGNELAIQHLWRACRNPKDLKKPAFPSPKVMRMYLTEDELGVLYNHYLTVKSEVGPITATMSDEEYEAIVRRLSEGGNADPFDSLSWDQQRILVVSMASQLASYWTDTSSAGSQRDENTSPSSEPKPSEESPSDGSDPVGQVSPGDRETTPA